jgi:hypothetical protein
MAISREVRKGQQARTVSLTTTPVVINERVVGERTPATSAVDTGRKELSTQCKWIQHVGKRRFIRVMDGMIV